MLGQHLRVTDVITAFMKREGGISYEQANKWLRQLETTIMREVLIPHGEKVDDPDMLLYGSDTVLTAPPPYARVYDLWLTAQADLAHNEIAKYNNSITTFQAEYDRFTGWYNRTHRPVGEKLKFW